MKCISCEKKESIAYEEIGLGQYCQDCLDREIKIWEQEAGFSDDIKEVEE